uniref:MADF domain-containing protein n=1 Tax=Daphnia galeata TaxID=27404 RepID=A0A8J2RU30_9CRUS|nr:unnamed protein product [Daphnia galeata]
MAFTEISNTFYWTLALEEKVILMIQHHPCLYDRRLSDFKNIEVRNNAFITIAKSIGCGIGEVSSKWTKLKEKYTRERKLMLKAPSGSAATPKSTWPLYEAMNFFSASIQTRNRSCSLKDAQIIDLSVLEEDSECGTSNNEEKGKSSRCSDENEASDNSAVVEISSDDEENFSVSVETIEESKSINPNTNTFYWSFDLEEKLILKIKENPCLYDIEHRDFKNSAARNLCIHKIAQHLGCGLFDVAKKYRELREQYAEESKSLATGSEPLWPLFHAMGFLKTHLNVEAKTTGKDQVKNLTPKGYKTRTTSCGLQPRGLSKPNTGLDGEHQRKKQKTDSGLWSNYGQTIADTLVHLPCKIAQPEMSIIRRVKRLIAFIASVLLIEYTIKQRRRRPLGRRWVDHLNAESNRMMHGSFRTILAESRLGNQSNFSAYIRLTPSQFEYVHEKVAPFISRRTTRYRRAISTGERLALTLRFLATGESLQSLHFCFRVGVSTASMIVNETCEVIYQTMSGIHLKPPTTPGEWNAVSEDFYNIWNFPHCLGALDGKHIRIKCPKLSGSEFYNYKNYHSIILMALADAKYRFLITDIGASGREGDASVFSSSSLASAMKKNRCNIPKPAPLPKCDWIAPFFIVGDEAFPLSRNLMRPFAGRKTGLLLSRARRVIENAFGLLVARWRIFKTEIQAQPEQVDWYAKACCVLHNYLQTDNEFETEEMEALEDELDSVVNFFRSQEGSEKSNEGAKIRDILKSYFLIHDSLSWQHDHVTNDGYNSENLLE